MALLRFRSAPVNRQAAVGPPVTAWLARHRVFAAAAWQTHHGDGNGPGRPLSGLPCVGLPGLRARRLGRTEKRTRANLDWRAYSGQHCFFQARLPAGAKARALNACTSPGYTVWPVDTPHFVRGETGNQYADQSQLASVVRIGGYDLTMRACGRLISTLIVVFCFDQSPIPNTRHKLL